jgi:hypothetical protein
MDDGLYLNGKWVADPEIAITFQANVLTVPDALSVSYTNTVTLPDSLDARVITGLGHNIHNAGEQPYKFLKAYVLKNGAKIFSGVAKLKQFTGGWQVELKEVKAGLFDALNDKSLRSLDLSRYDHYWNLSSMQVLNAVPDAVVYPLIDYGTIEGNVVPADTMFPAVSAKMLINQMLAESGYSATGDWLDDPLLSRAVLPFVEQEPTAHDDVWVKDRQARVSLPEADEIKVGGLGLFDSFHSFNRIQPFSIDNQKLDNFIDGNLDNYKATIFTYIPDTAMRLNVRSYQQFRARVQSGAVEVKLSVLVNGAVVEQAYFSKGGPYNLFGGVAESLAKKDELNLKASVNLKAGDQVQVLLEVNRRTKLGAMEVIVYQTHLTSWAAFIPDNTIQYGDKWPVARNLPDMKCLDLFYTVAIACSGWWDVDELRKRVRLVRLNDTIALPQDDWSDRITDAEPTLVPFVDPYAQKNYLKWKEADGVDKGFGDGMISCPFETLDAETTLFELPFAATMPSKEEVAGYGNPLKIETRTVTTSGGTTTISKKAAIPRIILIEPGTTFNVSTKIAGVSPGIVVDSTCSLMGCWFGIRPLRVVKQENEFSLAFDPLKGQYAEQSMIQRYFDALRLVLRRPRTLTASFYLRPRDIADLQAHDNNGNTGMMRPIKLKMVRAGSISISYQRFLINKIPDLIDGSPVNATLIAY